MTPCLWLYGQIRWVLFSLRKSVQHAARQLQPEVFDRRLHMRRADVSADRIQRREVFFKCRDNRGQDREVRCPGR